MSGVCLSFRTEISCAAGMTHQLSCTPLSMGSAVGQVTLWTPCEGGPGGKGSVMSTYTCHVCACSCWGLSGNLSTLMNAINLNTRVDLAPTKNNPRLSFKLLPTPTSKPFTITTQRTRDRGNIAGSIFNTCFCCNHTDNPVLSEWLRWGKAYDLQCLNISRLLQQAWVKDHSACSQGNRSERQ